MNNSSKSKVPPLFLVKMILRIVNFLGSVQKRLLPPPGILLDHTISDIVKVRCVYLAAELGIADLLKDGPKSIDQLANETGTNPDALYRLMRALSSIGIFKTNQRGQFETNRLGKNLQSDMVDTLSYFIKIAGSEWIHCIWGDMLQTLKNGKSFYKNNHGICFFDWLQKNPEAHKPFDKGMTSVSTLSDIPVIAAYDFSPFGTIVDVGGGYGSQIVTILKAFPKTKGVLHDLPSAIEVLNKEDFINQSGLTGRLECIGGDFLVSIPAGYDAYFVKSIFHDWDDENALKILSNCRKAMRGDSTLIIVECMIKYDNNTPEFGKFLDINVMALMDGRIRTREEFNSLFEKSGLQLKRILPTASIFSIIEAKPV
jgi:hypothetical protein